MRSFFPAALLLFVTGLAACTTPAAQPPLPEGTWTGTLAPMNHPEMKNAVTYEVGSPDGALAISLVGPGNTSIPTRDITLDTDTLRFTFDEPEEHVPLHCALGAQADDSYAGRCTDASGKWARFTMVPPAG